MKICSVEGCEKKTIAKGLCNPHYKRMARHGDPTLGGAKLYTNPDEAFAAKTISTDSGCIIWTGNIVFGYGQHYGHGRRVQAHRYAWEKVNGPVPAGFDLDHECRNRSCVNVEHLRLSTRKENCENLPLRNINNTSGYRGVSWSKRSGKWRVTVRHFKKSYHGGFFDDLDEANLAAIALRNKLFTHNVLDRRMSERQ